MNKHFVRLFSYILLSTMILTPTLHALMPPMFGPAVGGFPEPTEEELMMLFSDPEFQKFMLEEEGIDLTKEFPGLAQEVREEASGAGGAPLAVEPELDARTLFLTPPTEGEKGKEKAVLSVSLINAYDQYLNSFVTELQHVAQKIRAYTFGIDIRDLQPLLVTIDTMTPRIFSVAHIGGTLDEEIERNVFLKDFFKNEYQQAREQILESSSKLAKLNQELATLTNGEAAYATYDPKTGLFVASPHEKKRSTLRDQMTTLFAQYITPIAAVFEKIEKLPEGKKVLEELRKKREKEEKEAARTARRTGTSYRAPTYRGGSYGGGYGGRRYERGGYRGGYGPRGLSDSNRARFAPTRREATKDATRKLIGGPGKPGAPTPDIKKEDEKKKTITGTLAPTRARRGVSEIINDLIKTGQDMSQLFDRAGEETEKAVLDTLRKEDMSSLRLSVNELVLHRMKKEKILANEKLQRALEQFIKPIIKVTKFDITPLKEKEKKLHDQLKEANKPLPEPEHDFGLYETEQVAAQQALESLLRYGYIADARNTIGNELVAMEKDALKTLQENFEDVQREPSAETLATFATNSARFFKEPSAYTLKDVIPEPEAAEDEEKVATELDKHIDNIETLAQKVFAFLDTQRAEKEALEKGLARIQKILNKDEQEKITKQDSELLSTELEQIEDKLSRIHRRQYQRIRSVARRGYWNQANSEAIADATQQVESLKELGELWAMGKVEEEPAIEAERGDPL